MNVFVHNTRLDLAGNVFGDRGRNNHRHVRGSNAVVVHPRDVDVDIDVVDYDAADHHRNDDANADSLASAEEVVNGDNYPDDYDDDYDDDHDAPADDTREK